MVAEAIGKYRFRSFALYKGFTTWLDDQGSKKGHIKFVGFAYQTDDAEKAKLLFDQCKTECFLVGPGGGAKTVFGPSSEADFLGKAKAKDSDADLVGKSKVKDKE